MATERKSSPDSSSQESYITDAPGMAPSGQSSTARNNLNKLGQDEPWSVTDEKDQNPLAYRDDLDQDEANESEDRAGNTASLTNTSDDPAQPGNEDADDQVVMGNESDVTAEDLQNLGSKDQDLDGGDDEDGNRVGLDQTDEDGDPLNEASGDFGSTGDDLDVPGAGEDDPGDDATGEGDEENDYYSLGSDKNDNMNEGTP